MKKLTKDLKNHDYFLEAYTAGVSASAVLIKGATITTPIYARIPLFRRAERRQRCDCRRCHRLYGTYRDSKIWLRIQDMKDPQAEGFTPPKD